MSPVWSVGGLWGREGGIIDKEGGAINTLGLSTLNTDVGNG